MIFKLNNINKINALILLTCIMMQTKCMVAVEGSDDESVASHEREVRGDHASSFGHSAGGIGGFIGDPLPYHYAMQPGEGDAYELRARFSGRESTEPVMLHFNADGTVREGDLDELHRRLHASSHRGSSESGRLQSINEFKSPQSQSGIKNLLDSLANTLHDNHKNMPGEDRESLALAGLAFRTLYNLSFASDQQVYKFFEVYYTKYIPTINRLIEEGMSSTRLVGELITTIKSDAISMNALQKELGVPNAKYKVTTGHKTLTQEINKVREKKTRRAG